MFMDRNTHYKDEDFLLDSPSGFALVLRLQGGCVHSSSVTSTKARRARTKPRDTHMEQPVAVHKQPQKWPMRPCSCM